MSITFSPKKVGTCEVQKRQVTNTYEISDRPIFHASRVIISYKIMLNLAKIANVPFSYNEQIYTFLKNMYQCFSEGLLIYGTLYVRFDLSLMAAPI